MLGLEYGYTDFKLFPASVLGTATARALQGPFPQARFCATGGITRENAGNFLAVGNIRMVGLSWLTPADAVAAGDWERIRALSREAAAL
jgi:2-dehydro-3-deoxyphosphogluconate aldolase/(4S)-4-hydroxy-2-oxoglutarate aldolase